jgi:hypothetical protein
MGATAHQETREGPAGVVLRVLFQPPILHVVRSPVPALVLSVTLVFALASTRCNTNGASGETPEILEISQGTFTGGDYPLQVEWRDEPRVLELRQRERLDEKIAGAKGEIEIFKRLTSWARSQFEPGVPEPYPLCNGLTILDEIRAGRTGGFCGQYSYLLGDALKSFGYFAVRYVELESQTGAGHFAVEAWCDDLNRWVLLDPLNAAIYVRDGRPLSALEIHDELIAGRAASIRINHLPFTTPAHPARPAPSDVMPPKPASSDAEILGLFYNIAVSTRNDFARLQQPLTIAQREVLFLRYADPRVQTFRNMNFALSTGRQEDILVPMNQVQIDIKEDAGMELLHIMFSTRGTSPHFVRYRVKIGDSAWKDTGAKIAWTLAPGENHLQVRSVNAYEVLGPIFTLRVKV